jgi:hypothetical protein
MCRNNIEISTSFENIMTDKISRLAQYLDYKHKSLREAEGDLGIGNGRIGKMIKNATAVNQLLSEKILHTYGEINPIWWETGEGNMLKVVSKEKKQPSNAIAIGELQQKDGESSFVDLSNGKFLMIVPKVPIKAQAGYIEHYFDEQYIEDHFEKEYFVVNQIYRGKYMSYVVDGDSMDDGSKNSITEGSTVLARDVQKTHWRNKLHLHRFKDYVIVHKDGIFIKRITQHDTDKGTITCNSLNPDKEKHADFDLRLDDCLQILNVVRVTQER